jgi:hypothetical protein
MCYEDVLGDYDPPPTVSELIQHWAQCYGAEHPDREWLTSDWDTIVRNPFYTGPKHVHPEIADAIYEQAMTAGREVTDDDLLEKPPVLTCEPLRLPPDDDDIPF